MGADARPQALLARALLAAMLAYLRSATFLARARATLVGAYLRSAAFLTEALDALVKRGRLCSCPLLEQRISLLRPVLTIAPTLGLPRGEASEECTPTG